MAIKSFTVLDILFILENNELLYSNGAYYCVDNSCLSLLHSLPLGCVHNQSGHSNACNQVFIKNIFSEEHSLFNTETGKVVTIDFDIPRGVERIAKNDDSYIFQEASTQNTATKISIANGALSLSRLPFELRSIKGVFKNTLIVNTRYKSPDRKTSLTRYNVTDEVINWESEDFYSTPVFLNTGVALQSEQSCNGVFLSILDLDDGEISDKFEVEKGGSGLNFCRVFNEILYIKGLKKFYCYSLENRKLRSLDITSGFGENFLVSSRLIFVAGNEYGVIKVYCLDTGNYLGERQFNCFSHALSRFYKVGKQNLLLISNYADKPDWRFSRLLIWDDEDDFLTASIADESIDVDICMENLKNGNTQYRVAPTIADFSKLTRQVCIAVFNVGVVHGFFDMNPAKKHDENFAGNIVVDCTDLSLTEEQVISLSNILALLPREMSSHGYFAPATKKSFQIEIVSNQSNKLQTNEQFNTRTKKWSDLVGEANALIESFGLDRKRKPTIKQWLKSINNTMPNQLVRFDPTDFLEVSAYENLLYQLASVTYGSWNPVKIQTHVLDKHKRIANVKFEDGEKPFSWEFDFDTYYFSEEFLQFVIDYVNVNTSGEFVVLPNDDAWIDMIFLPKDSADKIKKIMKV